MFIKKKSMKSVQINIYIFYISLLTIYEGQSLHIRDVLNYCDRVLTGIINSIFRFYLCFIII